MYITFINRDLVDELLSLEFPYKLEVIRDQEITSYEVIAHIPDDDVYAQDLLEDIIQELEWKMVR